MKVWEIIFGIICLVGIILSLFHGNLFYLTVCSTAMFITIATSNDDKEDET